MNGMIHVEFGMHTNITRKSFPDTDWHSNLQHLLRSDACGMHNILLGEAEVLCDFHSQTFQDIVLFMDSMLFCIFRVCNRRNKKVYAWTVDDAESMKKMLYEHVDAVVTSNPTSLQQIMQDMETQCFEEGFSLSRWGLWQFKPLTYKRWKSLSNYFREAYKI